MKYTFRVKNLDCANCAAKVESAVAKINGITACSLNFFSQKLILESDNELDVNTKKLIQKVASRVERDILIIMD